MVRSIDDYEGWKEETKKIYLKKFPSKIKYITKFMEYINKLYDKHNRIFLPRQFMWYLYGKKRWVINKNQHFWIAFIGRKGGEGKSTLANHCLYFLDETYKQNRSNKDYDSFLKCIYNVKRKEKIEYPSALLDEPESKTHPLSKRGREIQDSLGKIRILHLFAGICANSLTSIPSFIYERLSAIVFIEDNHRFWLWDSSKDEPKYTIVDDIKGKDGWSRFRHGVFKKPKFVRRAHFKNLGFSGESLFDVKKYEEEKEEDVLEGIGRIIKSSKPQKSPKDFENEKNDRLTMEILRLKKQNPNLTDEQVGIRLGLSRQWVNFLRNRAIKCQ